jgi:hypothetical protein
MGCSNTIELISVCPSMLTLITKRIYNRFFLMKMYEKAMIQVCQRV